MREMEIRKAVIPAAGLGTPFDSVTKRKHRAKMEIVDKTSISPSLCAPAP